MKKGNAIVEVENTLMKLEVLDLSMISEENMSFFYCYVHRCSRDVSFSYVVL